MAVNSVKTSDPALMEQRRAEDARAAEQKKMIQNNREVDDKRRTAEQGRGDIVDVSA